MKKVIITIFMMLFGLILWLFGDKIVEIFMEHQGFFIFFIFSGVISGFFYIQNIKDSNMGKVEIIKLIFTAIFTFAFTGVSYFFSEEIMEFLSNNYTRIAFFIIIIAIILIIKFRSLIKKHMIIAITVTAILFIFGIPLMQLLETFTLVKMVEAIKIFVSGIIFTMISIPIGTFLLYRKEEGCEL